MYQYLDLLRQTIDKGHYKEDRTGTGTYSVFGHQMRFDLKEGFPMVTTKRVPFRSVLSELLWFLSGSTNVHDLRAILHGEEFRFDESKKTIWDDNYNAQAKALGYSNGELGRVYGAQWKRWPGETYADATIDQIEVAINTLKTNPDSRRIIVTAWNPAELELMALPPCHALFQFYSRVLRPDERMKWHQKHNGGQLLGSTGNLEFLGQVLDKLKVPRRELSCQLYQRSCDLFLGVPFNIASYALLTHMVANVTDHSVGEFVWTGGDCHVYANHVDQVKLQLTREPLELPKLQMDTYIKDINRFKMTSFHLEGYEPHDGIAAPMAV